MFSYVAKSLLSKTLRTFLRRYLENIELESIDFGSSSTVSGDVDSGKNQNTSGSGWGVRLSNVKLREGMELIKLPGKRKRVVTRKKKVKRKKRCKESSDAVNDSTPVTKNSKKSVQVGDDCNITQQTVSDASAKDNAPDTSHMSEEKQGVLSIHEKLQNRDRLLTADSENGYFSSSPPTPNQSRHGLCGLRSSICSNENSTKGVHLQQELVVNRVPISFDGDQFRPGDAVVNGEEDLCTQSFAQKKEGLDQSVTAEVACEPSPEYSATADGDVADGDVADGDADDDDSYIEVEEEEVVEDDMALVVGAGGMIGTLNIRLVGKELHVTIEDAHLIVESISVSDKGHVSAQDDGNSPQKPNLDRSTSSSSDAEPTPMDDDEGSSTIGERIKTKSVLARYLSMIPHLFLRDCRISLILPEEMGEDGESTSDSCDECTVFEVGIDFLSVTSGDFLDVLRFDTGNRNPSPLRRSKSVGSERSRSSSEQSRRRVGGDQGSNNVFQRKRIRTGKGPDGGVWLKVHPPLRKTTQPSHFNRSSSGPKWARQKFLDSSSSFFFRCSGIDLHARMLVDIKDDEEDEALQVSAWRNEYEDYTMDSMLFGVDYVDPITLTRHQIKKTIGRDHLTKPNESELDDIDSNGIQSIPFASNCHYISQGRHRNDCSNSHLPLNDCYFCWNECACRKQSSTSPMNEKMPLPGFVFFFSVSDPLEVNIDRSSLEALGYMKSLFLSKKPSVDDEQRTDLQEKAAEAKQPQKDAKAQNDPSPSWDFDSKSFPKHMQPDAIYLSGIYVSQVIVRIEAIKPRIDCGPKFRFWQFVGGSIHYEESQVDSDEQFLRDATFHVGGMELKELVGACRKNLVVAGLDAEAIKDESEITLPFAASRVLGVFSPIALEKQSRTSYAFHARLIQSNMPKEEGAGDEAIPRIRYANMRMGMIDVNVDSTISGDVSKVIKEASLAVLGEAKKAEKRNKAESKQGSSSASKWLLQLSTRGGTLSYRPRIKLQIPYNTFRVRKGAEGTSFEAFLERMGIGYGSYIFERPTPPSVTPLCTLPENLRMSIFLYLGAGDLTSLERVFNIRKKKKASAFLRANALNHHISKLKLPPLDAGRSGSTAELSRRNIVLSRLQSLDTDSLEALLTMHGRSKGK